MIARIQGWAKSLKAADISLHISVDVSHGVEAAVRLHRELSAKWVKDGDAGAAAVVVHTYTEAEMRSSFLHLTSLQRKMVGEPEWSGLDACAEGENPEVVAKAATAVWRKWAGGARSSIAWGFHTEALALWWAEARGLLPSAGPEHVWVLEDDVGFTAPLAELVAQYADSQADLITAEPWILEPLTNVRCRTQQVDLQVDQLEETSIAWEGWCWQDTCTEAYAALVPHSKRLVTKEHAQRFSYRLLEEIIACVRKGCSAWSEQFSPSLCNVMDGFSCEALREHNLPPNPDTHFSCTGRVSEDEYRAMCRDDTTKRGILLHALKW